MTDTPSPSTPDTDQQTSRRRFHPLAYLPIVVVMATVLTAVLLLPARAKGQKPDAMAQHAFTEITGVRLVRVAISSGGGMLDLRYRVVDADKAVVVHDSENPPTIIDESSGVIIDTPWMDHTSGRPMHNGVTYYTLLMNREGKIQQGSLVTVILGNTRLEHVIVE